MDSDDSDNESSDLDNYYEELDETMENAIMMGDLEEVSDIFEENRDFYNDSQFAYDFVSHLYRLAAKYNQPLVLKYFTRELYRVANDWHDDDLNELQEELMEDAAMFGHYEIFVVLVNDDNAWDDDPDMIDFMSWKYAQVYKIAQNYEQDEFCKKMILEMPPGRKCVMINPVDIMRREMCGKLQSPYFPKPVLECYSPICTCSL